MEALMVTQLEMITVWIPERMGPGKIFPLERPQKQPNEPGNDLLAVLACPECGEIGLISRLHLAGIYPVICGSDQCSAEYFLRDENIVPRKPM
jgi:hypothetical protein